MRKVAFVAEPKQRIAKNKALAKNILRTTSKLANICRTFMAKLNHIKRYRFDSETNLALQKLGKKESQEVRQCIREMLEKKGLLKPIKLPF